MSLKLIVVGKTGNGKSSTCNTLVGARRFKSQAGANAVTTFCQLEQNNAMGLTIVDTPGICDSEAHFKERALEIQRSVTEICREPHAFLLIFKHKDRCTTDDKMTIALLGIIFGEEVFEHSIVVLTHGCNNCERNRSPDWESIKDSDDYENEQSEHLNDLESSWSENETLSRLVERCNRRVLRIENDVRIRCTSHTNTTMFDQLIRYVNMVSHDGNVVYKNDFINTHRQTLEEQTAQYDTLQEMIVNLQQTLNENLNRARAEERERIRMEEMHERVRRAEERERMMKERERRKRERNATIAITLVSAFGGMAGAGALAGVVGAAVGGPVGALVGLAIVDTLKGSCFPRFRRRF